MTRSRYWAARAIIPPILCAAAPALQPIEPRLAQADVQTGRLAAHALCGACHAFAEGEASRTGPNLYDVVRRRQAALSGYGFSRALRAHHGTWTYDALNAWLLAPAAYAPGTTMAFPGVADSQQRADIIAYLRLLSRHPAPAPPPPDLSRDADDRD